MVAAQLRITALFLYITRGGSGAGQGRGGLVRIGYTCVLVLAKAQTAFSNGRKLLGATGLLQGSRGWS